MVLFIIELPESKYFLQYSKTRDNLPKNSRIIYEAVDEQELLEAAQQYHQKTLNDPNRVFQLPEHNQRPKHTAETKRKISNSTKDRTWSEESNQKRSAKLKQLYATGKKKKPTGHLGEKLGWTHRARMREAASHRKRLVCEHCGEECAVNMYHRWHGENCRMNW